MGIYRSRRSLTKDPWVILFVNQPHPLAFIFENTPQYYRFSFAYQIVNVISFRSMFNKFSINIRRHCEKGNNTELKSKLHIVSCCRRVLPGFSPSAFKFPLLVQAFEAVLGKCIDNSQGRRNDNDQGQDLAKSPFIPISLIRIPLQE